MPGSILGELSGELLKGIFEVGCYYGGRVVAPIVSFGRWKCDRLLADVPKQKRRGGGWYHLRGQQIYLTPEATSLMGLLFVVIVATLGIWISYVMRNEAG